MFLETVLSTIEDCFNDICTIEDGVSGLRIFLTAMIALIGRHEVREPIFTPRYLPGRNKPRDKH